MPTFVYPRIRLDGLLRQAAVRDPAGCGLRTAAGPVTFAELDDRADRIAAYLEDTLGRRGARVGVANTLDAVFPAAYYGTARSGNTVVLVNPLLRAEGLEHVLASAAVEVAFVPTATAELLVKLADRLPVLRTVVVTDASEGIVPSDAVPLRAALDFVPGRRPLPALATDLDADVCVQFTTGTTGRPKGVRLSHRNLVANAAQTAAAHHLGSDSVTLNHLPLYHVMHLNSAMYAGAEQVLCADPDPWASLRYAAEAGATHYYGLPARLHRLARDERLLADGGGAPGGPRLTVVLSGGTALAPPAARVLSEHIGVPVVQGYGMAELSPLSHCQSPYGPGTTSAVGGVGGVGGVVPGTECRIVHLDTRQVLGARATGEVQVRGPQVMAGYLDDSGPAPVDADGWFSTGDVGHLNDDGQLFLVDRLGDVFKHDNELVSPSAVEAVLREDPRVTDCIAAGWPDDVHGAVVWAGIVLRDPAAPGLTAVVDSIVEQANERLAPYERIRRAEVLEAVPRTPVGKPERRVLRQQLITRAAEEVAV
ncbi:class I adenylate-forming enzyme family protein [Streptomyces sp. NPDC001966]